MSYEVGQKVKFVGGFNAAAYRETPAVGAEGTVVCKVSEDRIFVVFPDYPLPISENRKQLADLIFGHIEGYNRDAWPMTTGDVQPVEAVA